MDDAALTRTGKEVQMAPRYAIVLDSEGNAVGQLERCGEKYRGYANGRAIEYPADQPAAPEGGQEPYRFVLVDEPLMSLGTVIA